ncbi:MAG: cupin domain-containing protein [Terracidiphilus sp.]
MHYLGSTRSSLKADHLLQTPDTFIRSPLPGAEGVEFIIHAAPQLGARFTQMTAEFVAGGSLAPALAQRFLYVLDGKIEVKAGGKRHILKPGSYAYLPQDAPHTVRAPGIARIAVIEKPYQPPYEQSPGVTTPEATAPEILIADEGDVAPVALMGDRALRVRALMPDGPSYDFAVNIMTYDPGAALSMVEVHVMAYCPQWFGALGKKPAKYLIYKDWRRHPLGDLNS